MNFWKNSLLFITAIMVLSGCDKKIDILKNPNIPTYPTQSTYDGVGLFTAYSEGVIPPPDVVDYSATDSEMMAVLSIYGIDKDGKTVMMKDQSGNQLNNRTMRDFLNVKSGIIFSTNSTTEELTEIFFTGDGKTATKLAEGFSFYNMANGLDESGGFKVPYQKDFEYLCGTNSMILQWNDKNKTLNQVTLDHQYSGCRMFSNESGNIVATFRSPWEMQGNGFSRLTEIKTSDSGEITLNRVLDKSTNMFSYYDFDMVFKNKNNIFALVRIGGMGPSLNSLIKIDPETIEETLVSNFTEVQGSYYNSVSMPFGSEKVNGKIYLEARFGIEIPETPFPIDGEVSPDNMWSATNSTLLKVYSLDQEGNLLEEYTDTRPFTNYRVIKSGNQIYVSQETIRGLANGQGNYDNITTINLYNLSGVMAYTIPVELRSWYRYYNLGSNSAIAVLKNNEDETSSFKYYIPSAIAGGDLVTNSSFENLNLKEVDLVMYYGKVMFSILKNDEAYFKLGLVNLDGTLNTFSQSNATLGGKHVR